MLLPVFGEWRLGSNIFHSIKHPIKILKEIQHDSFTSYQKKSFRVVLTNEKLTQTRTHII